MITELIKGLFVNIFNRPMNGVVNVLTSKSWAKDTIEIHTEDGEVYLITIERKNERKNIKTN